MTGWNCFGVSVVAWMLSLGVLKSADPSAQTGLVLGLIGIAAGLFAGMLLWSEAAGGASPSVVPTLLALAATVANIGVVNWALKTMNAGIVVVPGL